MFNSKKLQVTHKYILKINIKNLFYSSVVWVPAYHWLPVTSEFRHYQDLRGQQEIKIWSLGCWWEQSTFLWILRSRLKTRCCWLNFNWVFKFSAEKPWALPWIGSRSGCEVRCLVLLWSLQWGQRWGPGSRAGGKRVSQTHGECGINTPVNPATFQISQRTKPTPQWLVLLQLSARSKLAQGQPSV